MAHLVELRRLFIAERIHHTPGKDSCSSSSPEPFSRGGRATRVGHSLHTPHVLDLEVATEVNGLTYIPNGWGSHGGDLLVYMWTGELWIADLDTGTASLLATLPGAVTGAAFDGGTLYALGHFGNKVVTVSPTGAVNNFATLSGCQPSGLSVDSRKRLFYICSAADEIRAYTLPSGPDTVIGQDNFENIAVPAVVLYDGVDSRIYSRLPGMWVDILEL